MTLHIYFPTRDAYGLSSVAGNTKNVVVFQKEVDIVKKRMDDDIKKEQFCPSSSFSGKRVAGKENASISIDKVAVVYKS
ncbi:hypothetical protein Tco_0064265 [Tanacetum coccineum]